MPAIWISAHSPNLLRSQRIAYAYAGFAPYALRQPKPVHQSIYALVIPHCLVSYLALAYRPLSYIVGIAHAAHALGNFAVFVEYAASAVWALVCASARIGAEMRRGSA